MVLLVALTLFIMVVAALFVVRGVLDGIKQSKAPRTSIQVLDNLVEIGIAYTEGPTLVQVHKDHIVAWETNSTGELTIVCTGGRTYRVRGISNEKSKELRKQLGWE